MRDLPERDEDDDGSDDDSSSSASDPSVDDGGNHAYVVEPESGLFPVKRSLEVTGSRKGLVVDLCRIWRPVDAIPYFGGSKNSNWTMETSVELAKTLLVNPYHEKDLFYDLLPSIQVQATLPRV